MMKKLTLIVIGTIMIGCRNEGIVDIQSSHSGIDIINNTQEDIFIHITEERNAGQPFTPICQNPIQSGRTFSMPMNRLSAEENTFVQVTWWHKKMKNGSLICENLDFHTANINLHPLKSPSADVLVENYDDGFIEDEGYYDQGFTDEQDY